MKKKKTTENSKQTKNATSKMPTMQEHDEIPTNKHRTLNKNKKMRVLRKKLQSKRKHRENIII